jgi:2-amino-4-hydroxy-6-hydroxymethyldihydropteridine diphosphokinase
MILIGLGANLPSEVGPPRATLEAALRALQAAGIRLERRSPWYRSAPLPPSGQAWYVNGVALAATTLGPLALLGLLHRVEAGFGRRRGRRNAPRVLDLDLLDYDGLVRRGRVDLPHPRLGERAFVLRPLADVAPLWRHPVTGRGLAELLASLPPEQRIERF